jgi:ankyrin repeat protein
MLPTSSKPILDPDKIAFNRVIQAAKPILIALTILGVIGIAVAATGWVGFGAYHGAWSAGALNQLGHLNSMIMIGCGTTVVIGMLIAGILKVNLSAEKHKDLITNTEEFSDSFLCEAVRDNSIERTKEILKRYPINGRDHEGNAPLGYAIRNKSIEMITLLLANGANPDPKGKDGSQHVERYSCSIYLASRSIKILFLLLDYGADINNQFNDLGYSLLHEAISRSDIELFNFAIERNINLELKQDSGHTAWHMLAKYLFINEETLQTMARILLEKGADIEARDNLDYTPLHLAVRSGNEFFVKFLLEKGAAVNATEKKRGLTPLCIGRVHERDSAEKREIFNRIIEILENAGGNTGNVDFTTIKLDSIPLQTEQRG